MISSILFVFQTVPIWPVGNGHHVTLYKRAEENISLNYTEWHRYCSSAGLSSLTVSHPWQYIKLWLLMMEVEIWIMGLYLSQVTLNDENSSCSLIPFYRTLYYSSISRESSNGTVILIYIRLSVPSEIITSCNLLRRVIHATGMSRKSTQFPPLNTVPRPCRCCQTFYYLKFDHTQVTASSSSLLFSITILS